MGRFLDTSYHVRDPNHQYLIRLGRAVIQLFKADHCGFQAISGTVCAIPQHRIEYYRPQNIAYRYRDLIP